MAQTWQLGVQKVRPGTYFRVSSGDVTTVGAVNGIAAVMFQSNWGPLNKVVNITQSDLNNLRDIFGEGEGVDAIKEALLGGASLVKAIRVGTEEGAKFQKAYITAPDSLDTRKSELTTTAANKEVSFLTDEMKSVVSRVNLVVKWGAVGSGGSNMIAGTDYELTETKSSDGKTYTKRTVKLTATGFAKLQADKKFRVYESYPAPTVNYGRIYARFLGEKVFTCSLKTNLVSGKRELTFYDEDLRVFEKVEFEAGGNEVTKLQEALNKSTKFRLATVYDEGLTAGAIADFTGRMMTTGVNPAVTVANYSDATDLLERQYWNVLLADSNAAKVRSVLSEFVKQSYETGHLGMAVLAGTTSETLDARLSYATALNDWRTVYLLHGWTDLNGVKYEGWRAAARIGGMIAACETNASLTHIVIDGASELLEALSGGALEDAEQKGCLCLSINDEGQIWIDNAINSLITLGNDMDDGWKKIRRTKCRFELMTRINRTCDKLVGRLNNDTNGRATLITAMQSVINEMIAEGKLFGGSYVAEDSRYKPVGDRAYFMLYIGDTDSIEKIYLDYRFSYANPFE